MGPPIQDVVEQICRRYPRYADRAFLFVLESLHQRIAVLDAPRHISGPELADAARELAIERFGPLARIVLEHWGIHGTSDIGEIVFLLIDRGVLTKRESDRKEDFDGLFSFEEAFEADYPWGGAIVPRKTG
ncbi:MAG: hypothetical protein RRA92_00400 [Gemmatimonadota bacterium]|nr:hypothetical protein [Gemmatimonadota bacterium]